MKTLYTITVLGFITVILATTAGADFSYPKLPWYERYFFPVGVKFSYELPLIPDDGDWSAWNYRMNNEIEWESLTDSGFDTIRFLAYYKPRLGGYYWREIGNPGATCFNRKLEDIDNDGVRDLVQANRYVLDRVKDLNVRTHFWPGDFNYVIGTDIGVYRDEDENYRYYCWPGECGGQGGTRPPDGQGDIRWCSSKPNIRNDIMDFYEDPDYSPPYDIYNDVIKEYDDQPNVVWYEVLNEPHPYEFTCTSVLNEFLDIYSPSTPGLTNSVDRTGHVGEHIYPDVTNFYEWMICRTDLKIHLARKYPFRTNNPPNSREVYYGFMDPQFNIQDFGFYGLENHLSRSRATSVKYFIPFWHFAEVSDHAFAGGSKPNRQSTPRELRAEVNMALTYGASGIFYYTPYDHRYFKEVEGEAVRNVLVRSMLDIDGDVKNWNYFDGQEHEGYEEPDYFAPTGIPYQTLYNELVDINTKLHHVRNTLQTTVSLDAFHSFDLANSLPRGLILDYEGNRTGRQWYSPDYTEETDFLDLGTFVCPYTGVRYFAVSDRFCNWPPATYPDPTEKDVATVRHPGRVITDIYYDLDDMPYNDIYTPVEGWDHDSGVSEFEFRLDNADGRVFKLDPCLTLAPGFEWVENPGNVWDYDGGYAWVPGVVDDVSRKGNNSLKLDKRESGGTWVVTNGTMLNIAGIGVGPFDVAPGATYRASGYIKADPGWDGSAKIQVGWYNLNNWPVDLLAETPSVNAETDWAGSDGWVYASVDFKVENIPPAAKKIGLNLALVGGTGNVWFDEVRLEPLSRVFNGHFEHDGGDWWTGPVFGWGYSLGSPGQKYWRSSPGYYGDYCLKVGAKDLVDNVVRNDEKLYLSKGTNYKVTGWAKKETNCPEAKVIVEFYVSNGDMFKKKSKTVPAGGDWHQLNISITPADWENPDPHYPIAPDTLAAYVRIACKVASGSPTKNAYFDNIELIETNLVANGSFELAEEGPHWPDGWDYPMAPIVPSGDPAWSALYDADSKYDRRC